MYFERVVFLYKQKTADEMRISDWSSDVCSSELNGAVVGGEARERLFGRTFGEQRHQRLALRAGDAAFVDDHDAFRIAHRFDELLFKIGSASCRERVCQYV